MPESQLGNLAAKYFWEEKYDSALYYLDSLEKVQPYEDYNIPLQINKMLIYAKMRNTNEFRLRVTDWIQGEDTSAVCTCLEQSPFFEYYVNEKWYKKLIKTCWKQKRNISYSNIKLTDQLMYLGMIDQNILFCKSSYGDRCNEITDSLLENNLHSMISLIDTLNFPTRSEVGIGGRQSIVFIILHSDFDPELQIRFGERMLKIPESYPPVWSCWIIDRALSYNGRKQRYGFYRSKVSPDELEEINSNRIAVGLEPLSIVN